MEVVGGGPAEKAGRRGGLEEGRQRREAREAEGGGREQEGEEEEMGEVGKKEQGEKE